MGDGVERALARASELEALVQNEVAALERTYSDNEVRIRGLLQDLATQRDTLVGQAEQVRSAINNVHIDLTQDLSTISDLVGQQVNEAAQRITHSLAEKGEHITLALGQVGDNMIQQLSERGGDLLERLETRQRRDLARHRHGERPAHLEPQLQDRPHRRGIRRDRARPRRHDDGAARPGHRGLLREVAGDRRHDGRPLAGSSPTAHRSIIAPSQIAETIATRADEVNSTLKATGESLVLDLNLRGGEVATKLEQTGARITEALVSRSAKTTDAVPRERRASRRPSSPRAATP